jgi:hypothetical protein
MSYWGPNVAQPIGSAQELPSSQIQTATKSNPFTENFQRELAQQRANEARARFAEREGYDRMGSDTSSPDFETTPPTPARAGVGLGVSPSVAAAGTAAGLALAVGSTMGAALSKPYEAPPPVVPTTGTTLANIPPLVPPSVSPNQPLVPGVLGFPLFFQDFVVTRSRKRRGRRFRF